MAIVSIQAKGEDGISILKSAIDVGYRHIDTAYNYLTEKEVGQAVANRIEAGVVQRQDLFITSKVRT